MTRASVIPLHLGVRGLPHPTWQLYRAELKPFTWPPSKVDSAQNLIVQALLKIATLRRSLWQGRAGRDHTALWACRGSSQ